MREPPIVYRRGLHNRGLIRLRAVARPGRRRSPPRARAYWRCLRPSQRQADALLSRPTTASEVTQITGCLARGSLLPNGQRFAHEPTRVDPVLGVAAYLEPDFAALTPMRAFNVPQQLRGPHPAVTAFQEKREHVSRAQIPRAARYLQGLVNAVAEMGWSAPAKLQVGYTGRGEPGPDLLIKLPSREFQVAIRELDERGRPGRAFITQTHYLTRTESTTVNKSYTASGRLEVTLTRGWERPPVLSQRDTGRSTLEDQLSAFIRLLEIDKAEAEWAQKEEERRADIRTERWEEERATAPRGGHLLPPRRTPAVHAWLEHLRDVPALGAACLG